MRGWAKAALGAAPWAAEVYQRTRHNGAVPPGGYRSDRLASALPRWASAIKRAAAPSGRRALVMSYLSWWLEHSSAVSILLASQGHAVDLAFLPYRTWKEASAPFDAHRQAAYLRSVLDAGRPWFRPIDLLRVAPRRLPVELQQVIDRQSLLDVQYTQQREAVNLDAPPDSDLYRLRRERNVRAAAAVLRLLTAGDYSVVIVPNGSILEFAAVYHAARSVGIPVVTYEFGEQRERMWLARDTQVMRQDTSGVWAARGSVPLTEAESGRVQDLYRARRGGESWGNFARQWQAGVSQGAAATRQVLGLDSSTPLVLLCTNVVGDSLALDRQIFTEGMSDWLARTVQHFASRPDVQVVVRVHPGELLGAGQPSVEIVRQSLPDLGGRVVVVPPDSKINTYDLMELSHIGVVYTSTVGMELAMTGVPVIVAGDTHYRGKGFTDDPATWQQYVECLDRRVAESPGRRLPGAQIDLAWRYAYRFFFEYPMAYPWHLIGFWDDMAARPLEGVVRSKLSPDLGATVEALMAISSPSVVGASA